MKMTSRVTLTINGQPTEIDAPRITSLLAALRRVVGITSAKEVCNEGECGACTVLVDGKPVTSCITPLVFAHGKSVSSIEGVNEEPRLRRLQDGLAAHGAVQCGYCFPGIELVIHALFKEMTDPSDAQIREALAGNICRCTGYSQIVEAIAEMRAENKARTDDTH